MVFLDNNASVNDFASFLQQMMNQNGQIMESVNDNDQNDQNDDLNVTSSDQKNDNNNIDSNLIENIENNENDVMLSDKYESIMIDSICSWNDRCFWSLVDSHVGSGIIKEPSFDTTSNIIASPYYNGVRLLNVNNAKIIKNIYGNEKLLNTHTNHVYTAQFSHYLPYLATGGQDGRVCIYYPR